MLAYFVPLTALVYPIATIPAPDSDAGPVLPELDQLASDRDRVICARDDAARALEILRERIAVARLALQG